MVISAKYLPRLGVVKNGNCTLLSGQCHATSPPPSFLFQDGAIVRLVKELFFFFLA